MPLYPIAIAAGVIPLLTIHISYGWAASNGHVDWCIPYIDSCTSISATGRQPPESYFFKPMMTVTAMLLAVYWWLAYKWFTFLGYIHQRWLRWIIVLGWLSCLGLALYSFTLGLGGDTYRLQRRIGVSSFFGFGYLTQLLLVYALGKTTVIISQHRHLLVALEGLAVLILIIGITSVAISAYDDQLYHRLDDAFEWLFSLLLCLHIILTGEMWRRTGYR